MKNKIYFNFDALEKVDVDKVILDTDEEFITIIRTEDNRCINLVCTNAEKIGNDYYINVERVSF